MVWKNENKQITPIARCQTIGISNRGVWIEGNECKKKKKKERERERYPYYSGELYHKFGHTENLRMLARDVSSGWMSVNLYNYP